MRYWSAVTDDVRVMLYKAIDLGHATGTIVYDEMTSALDKDGVSLTTHFG